MLPRQQAFSIHETTSVEKEQLYKSHLEVSHGFISPEVAVRILSTE